MLTRSSAVLCALILAACGGNSGNDADAPPHVDSRPTVDAPPFMCQLDASYPALTIGSMGTPAAINGQKTMTTMDYAVALLATLPMRTTDPRAAVLVLMIDNAGMFAAGGGAGPLTGPPTPGSYPLDGGDTCGGCLESYTGYSQTGNQADLTTATQVYTVDTAMLGNLTITQFEAAGPNVTGQVFASYDNVKLIGFDPVTMAENGCTTTFTQLNLFLNVTWPAAFAPSNGPRGPHGIDLSRVPTLDATF